MSDIRLGDCLDLLPDIPDGTVDCVYLDPPFNTGKDWGEYDDRWVWDETREQDYWLLGKSEGEAWGNNRRFGYLTDVTESKRFVVPFRGA